MELWLYSLKVAQLLRSAACLHTNQSRSYLNHLVRIILLQVVLEDNNKIINYGLSIIHYCILKFPENYLYKPKNVAVDNKTM